MNAKKLNYVFILIGIVFIGLAIFFVASLSKEVVPREPIIFSGESGSLAEMNIDDLILQSNLVAIGRFDSIPPSKWNTPTGQLPEDATSQTVWDENLFIYTEQVFQLTEILKIDPQSRELLIRTFGGQVGEDIMETSNLDVIYTTEQEYLLFLTYYPDRVDDDTPGYYLASGSIQGVYKIMDGKAISFRDEWLLNELVAYIQDSKLSKVDVPDASEVRKIIQQIEAVYDVEAGCTFDFSVFPDFYINDPRYELDEERLSFVRMATDNPDLEIAGYLDYKTTYYSWWLEGKRQWEEIYNKARSENRDISKEEQDAFLSSKWGTYPGGWCSSKRAFPLIFISITFNEDISKVILAINSFTRRELTLVFNNGRWLVAQERNLSPSQ